MAKRLTKDKIHKNEKINRVKVVLAEKEVSQRHLAKELGVNVNTISNICNNITQPHLSDLKKIAKILNVDIRELLISTTLSK